MPPGRRDLVPRSRAQTPEPVEIRPLHHAFFVHIGAQEAAAEGLQPLDHFLGREVGRLLPALDHDLPVLRIERNQNPLRPHRRRDFFDHRRERRRADHDPMRPLIQQTAAHDPPCARRRRCGTSRAMPAIRPAPSSRPCPWPRRDRSPGSPGNAANRRSISSGASPSSALSRPWTSCTTLPSIKSMQGRITGAPRLHAQPEMF